MISVKLARGGPIKVQLFWPTHHRRRKRRSVNSSSLMACGITSSRAPNGWTARYNIVATTASAQPRSIQLSMLRGLLIDRFKLAIHRESKTLPIYALIVGKTGSKLKPMDENLPVPFELYSNFSIAPTSGGSSELRGYGSVGQLSDFLTRLVERPVLDGTGIAGNFDIRLLCAIDGYPGFETSPSVFDAVQSQLGLKLEARTSPVEITVVDHVEKPTEN